MKKFLKSFLILSVFFSFTSCISYRPVFDNNEKYESVGNDVAQADASVCMEEADAYLKDVKKRRALKEGARGVGWGSIFGGIFGFLVGGDTKGLVTGIAIGAGVGGVSGAGGVIAEDNLKPDEIKQRYVTNCLNRKGYGVIGWE